MTSAQTSAQATPTLLLFTLGVERESSRRRLLPGHLGELECSLHRQCLLGALAAGRACGFRVLVCSPEPPVGVRRAEFLPQAGGSFRERLQRATRAASSIASGPLLVVATDVPGLTPDLLRQAAGALAEDPERVVVGPSPDGGFYLLGFEGDLDTVLPRVAWRTPAARSSLLAAARASGRPVRLLHALSDLDGRADLERWVAGRGEPAPGWRLLLGRLAALLRQLCRPAGRVDRSAPQLRPRAPWSGRAPPAFAPA